MKLNMNMTFQLVIFVSLSYLGSSCKISETN